MTHSEPTGDDQDQAIESILQIYSGIGFKPPPKQFTVLASFYLTKRSLQTLGATNARQLIKVISISTGTKCTPAFKYSPHGELIHDSHAEVLARRGAVRWLLEEIRRTGASTEDASEWLTGKDGISSTDSDERPPYRLQDGVELKMYVSTLPCGDASMRYLASIQDPTMAALKSKGIFPALAPNEASRGRDNYNRLGVLRTKPGRSDSSPALSMSCSDKMAKWSVLGIQGSFGARFLEPVYVSEVVIGELEKATRAIVRADCERALRERIQNTKGLPEGYTVRPPRIRFTDVAFVHSKTKLDMTLRTTGSCNESLCWVADSRTEVLINGLKRSTSHKNRYTQKYRPLLSRISMFDLYNQVLISEGLFPALGNVYADAKATSLPYRRAKLALLGAEGPFAGWIKIDPELQRFTINGDYCDPATPVSA